MVLGALGTIEMGLIALHILTARAGCSRRWSIWGVRSPP